MENKYSKKYIIGTGIGLQDVDHLQNSHYFSEETQRYINGEISLDELDNIITSYYNSKPDEDKRNEEADKVSVRIGKLISEDSFTFTVGQYLSIHKFLFNGIIKHAGQLREYNFSKEEWVLDGASVTYGDYRELESTLQYDFSVEKKFNYAKLSIDEIIEHLAVFIGNLWQIHAFEEGNTRATAVFSIKYLRSLGFDVTNDSFEKNAWYFRNALVRANYANISKGVTEDNSFLILFLRNLILNEKNELNNRDLHLRTDQIINLDTKESIIIKLIRDNPEIKLEDLSNKLGVSLRTTKSIISKLKQQGAIERINGKRYGRWEVKLGE